jgi:cellulose synthase (UDP-forming)
MLIWTGSVNGSTVNRKGIALRLLIVGLFILLTLISIFFSVYLMLNANSTYVYFLAISFTALSLISGGFNIISSYAYYRSYFYDEYLDGITKKLKPLTKYPSVAVAMPSYNEDPVMLERNLKRLKQLNYDKKKLNFYVLDDSTKPEIKSATESLCKEHGVTYLHRNDRKGYKAGALNNMLKLSKEEFIAIFDADEYLTNKDFLIDLLPYFEDKHVAFVQTDKKYAKGTFFSDSVDLFNAMFFKFIQPSRALNGTAIFAGSCGIIRKSALDEIGGFPEYIIEDTFFSFESDMHDFKSIYIPKVYALGRPIYTFSELVHQQWRYNCGDTQFLLYFLRQRKVNTKRAISALSKIDYGVHGFGLNYLSSILILFTVVSILTVFSTAPFAFSSIMQVFTPPYTTLNLELLGITTLLLSVLVPVALTKAYFNSASKGLMIFILNFALAFVRLKGALSAVISSSSLKGWLKGSTIEGKSLRLIASIRSAMLEVSFSILLFGMSLIAILVYNISGAMWLLWYGLLYSSTLFFYYKYG